MSSNFDRRQAAFWRTKSNPRPYDHPVVEAFARQRIRFVRRWLGTDRIRTILDVGCGDGFGTHYAQALAAIVCGCDQSRSMLTTNPAPNRRLCQASAYALPYRDRSFDLVMSWELLHHTAHPVDVMKEMARVSKKYVLVFEPNALNIAMAVYGLVMPGERGLLRFTPYYLTRLARHSGTRPVIARSVGCFTPNLTPLWLCGLLSRLPFRWPVVGVSSMLLARV